MNVEYTYILNSFLPEIVLIAVGVLVLAVDLLLPRRNTRLALTLVAALGCLLGAGLSARQWAEGSKMPPPFVAQRLGDMAPQIGELPQAEFQKLMTPTGTALSPEAMEKFALARVGLPLEGLTNAEARQMVSVLHQPQAGRSGAVNTMLAHPGFSAWWFFANDQFAAAFKLIFSLALFLVLLFTMRIPVARYRGEFAGLLCFAAVGLMVMVNSLDLVGLFLGLELASVCLYALTAWAKDEPRSGEAGVKYLLLGSLASAFFIYGASLLFVKYGTTHLSLIALQGFQPEPLLIIGLLMLLVGFAFKIAAAPFHMWAPDVYQGGPTPVIAFLSTASKAAGFAVLLRVLCLGFINISGQWVMLIGLLAALSMLTGNLVAVHQNNVKRLLAYSGIAQAGYLLIAVMALGLNAMHKTDPADSVRAVIFYLFLYMVANIGAFAITGIVARESGSEEMSAFAGLRTRAPLLAFTMLLLLLSLGGIPLLSGFVGKWFIFLSGVGEGQYWLVLLGAALSVVSIYYYLLVAKHMYIYPAAEKAQPIRIGAAAGLGLLIIVALTVVIGVYPGPFLNLAQSTAMSLFGR